MIAAIKRLSVSGGTSLGQGLFTSLSTIAGKPLTIDEAALDSDAGAVNIGFFGSAAIVLLSDGENTTRLDPLKLAEVASTAGVRVHAIGVGTKAGTVVEIDGFKRRDGARRGYADAGSPTSPTARTTRQATLRR